MNNLNNDSYINMNHTGGKMTMHPPSKFPAHELVGVKFRFASIAVTMTSLFIAASYVFFKAYVKQTHSQIDAKLLLGAFVYFFLACIMTMYNLLYRFVIRDSMQDCYLADSMEEYLIVIARAWLLIYFTYRVEIIFRNTKYAFDTKYLNLFRLIAIIETLIMNVLWISVPRFNHRIQAKNFGPFGIYCSNSGCPVIVNTHLALDTTFNLFVLALFVNRIQAVIKDVDTTITAAHSKNLSMMQHNLNGANNINTINNNNNNNHNNNNNNTISSANVNVNIKKIHKTNSQLLKLIKIALRQCLLTFISVGSTWLFYLASITDSGEFYERIRWFYPLDWGINSWCVVLMFQFIKLPDWCLHPLEKITLCSVRIFCKKWTKLVIQSQMNHDFDDDDNYNDYNYNYNNNNNNNNNNANENSDKTTTTNTIISSSNPFRTNGSESDNRNTRKREKNKNSDDQNNTKKQKYEIKSAIFMHDSNNKKHVFMEKSQENAEIISDNGYRSRYDDRHSEKSGSDDNIIAVAVSGSSETLISTTIVDTIDHDSDGKNNTIPELATSIAMAPDNPQALHAVAFVVAGGGDSNRMIGMEKSKSKLGKMKKNKEATITTNQETEVHIHTASCTPYTFSTNRNTTTTSMKMVTTTGTGNERTDADDNYNVMVNNNNANNNNNNNYNNTKTRQKMAKLEITSTDTNSSKNSGNGDSLNSSDISNIDRNINYTTMTNQSKAQRKEKNTNGPEKRDGLNADIIEINKIKKINESNRMNDIDTVKIRYRNNESVDLDADLNTLNLQYT